MNHGCLGRLESVRRDILEMDNDLGDAIDLLKKWLRAFERNDVCPVDVTEKFIVEVERKEKP